MSLKVTYLNNYDLRLLVVVEQVGKAVIEVGKAAGIEVGKAAVDGNQMKQV